MDTERQIFRHNQNQYQSVLELTSNLFSLTTDLGKNITNWAFFPTENMAQVFIFWCTFTLQVVSVRDHKKIFFQFLFGCHVANKLLEIFYQSGFNKV